MPFFINRPIMPLTVPLDSDAQAWINQVVADGGTVSGPHQTVISAMIAGLKTDGVWTDIKRLWFHAIDDIFGAKRDMKALALLDAGAQQGTVDFTANVGISGDNGDGGSYNTGIDPDVLCTFPSMCLFGWSNTNVAADNGLIGDQSNGDSYVYPRNVGDVVQFKLANGGDIQTANTDGRGLFTVSRTSTTLATGYKNGSSIGTDATNVAGGTFHRGGQKIWVLRSAISYSDNDQMVTGIANGLSGAQVGNLYTRLHTALVAIAGIGY